VSLSLPPLSLTRFPQSGTLYRNSTQKGRQYPCRVVSLPPLAPPSPHCCSDLASSPLSGSSVTPLQNCFAFSIILRQYLPSCIVLPPSCPSWPHLFLVRQLKVLLSHWPRLLDHLADPIFDVTIFFQFPFLLLMFKHSFSRSHPHYGVHLPFL